MLSVIGLIAVSPLVVWIFACLLYGPVLRWLTAGMVPGDARIAAAAHSYGSFAFYISIVPVLFGGIVVGGWQARIGWCRSSRMRGVMKALGLVALTYLWALLPWFMGVMCFLTRIGGV